MSGWLRSRRARWWAVIAAILGIVLTLPLAIAFSLLGLKDMGVTARSLRGPVWWGGAEELTVGGVRLGTVDVFLDPLRLLIGQVRVDVARIGGNPETDFVGGISMGLGAQGLEGVSGSVPLGATLAPLPVTRAEFDGFTGTFAGGRCLVGQGRVAVHMVAPIAGLDLSNGLTGEARCEGDALLIPLASQSGQERLELRFRSDGAYEAAMRIRTSDPVLGGGLAANGFESSGGDFVLRIVGAL